MTTRVDIDVERVKNSNPRQLSDYVNQYITRTNISYVIFGDLEDLMFEDKEAFESFTLSLVKNKPNDVLRIIRDLRGSVYENTALARKLRELLREEGHQVGGKRHIRRKRRSRRKSRKTKKGGRRVRKISNKKRRMRKRRPRKRSNRK